MLIIPLKKISFCIDCQISLTNSELMSSFVKFTHTAFWTQFHLP